MHYFSSSIATPLQGSRAAPGNGHIPVLDACHESPASILIESGQGTAERLKVARGADLFSPGDTAGACVYAILYGSFKCSRHDEHGREQIFGFRLRGDFLALDTIGLERHSYHLTALEDSAVCVVPIAGLHSDPLSTHLLISKEVAREQSAALVLRNNCAESRLAHFFLDLASRYESCGLSARRFRLSMERQDIASYLALSPASISRALRKLQLAGLIDFRERDITILNKFGLLLLIANGSIDAVEVDREAPAAAPANVAAAARIEVADT